MNTESIKAAWNRIANENTEGREVDYDRMVDRVAAECGATPDEVVAAIES